MKILRVLNTNSILTRDADGNETVLLGAGLGFKSRKGDLVDESKIEKRFILKDKQQQNRFAELINTIPEAYIIVAEHAISLAKTMYDMRLNESIHISLADHLHTSVSNLKDGIVIPNILLQDIQQYYQSEYKIALETLEMVRSTFHVDPPPDEAGFIAMHFVNAQYGGHNVNVKKIISFVREINQMILSELKVTPNEHSLNYYRYMTHLKFFAKRVMDNFHYTETSNDILTVLLPRYEREYQCSLKVAQYIKENYNYHTNEEEILYLTVHLAHITSQQEEGDQR